MAAEEVVAKERLKPSEGLDVELSFSFLFGINVSPFGLAEHYGKEIIETR